MGNPGLPNHENLYGSHPVYLEMRNGQAHGVLLWNSNGMDIKIDQDSDGQYLEYNNDGGVLGFYFVSGPQPADVSRQYAEIIGKSSLTGRMAFINAGTGDVYRVAEVIYNYSAARIPLETMWTDIDYMNLRRTWNLDPDRFPLEKMQELVTYLHDHQQQYILMVDPPVSLNDSTSWQNAIDSDVLMKNSSGEVYVGGMWLGPVGYVDWFHPNSQSFWSGQITTFFDDESGVGVDGIWIDMNEVHLPLALFLQHAYSATSAGQLLCSLLQSLHGECSGLPSTSHVMGTSTRIPSRFIAPDNSGQATGSLYLDDDKSLNSTSSDIAFSYDNGHLVVNGTFGYSTNLQVISAKVLGNDTGVAFNFTKPPNAPWTVDIN
ncbi:glycosyl hydrolases family 31-domain-containing protein [Talaromyces proteolyticus]|uniref:Probable alpha/beta-glucosidase agdC n=1 Tax=Talaromyces proteolyticus TaxID=1131652 RepID=A0AAD4Q516_9EURO|nr:glycosyl hydrolases family 31-domain-containing protein [Talaromyces proteolyticus]KAH8703699.1 glycosyl hydrolases family 31-domain-containing protein [Talaromyces proteolyticus]